MIKCEVCGVEVIIDPNMSPNQDKLRALYFHAVDNVDFCGSICATEYNRIAKEIDGNT